MKEIDRIDLSVEVEFHYINGREYKVYFIPSKWWEQDPRVYGVAFPEKGIAHVRAELSTSLRKFVTYHEVYHLFDPYAWGGWIGEEFRANVVAAVCHPWGFIIAIWKTLASAERRSLYKDRLRGGY